MLSKDMNLVSTLSRSSVNLNIDNKKSIGEILSIVDKSKNIQQKQLFLIFKTLYKSLLLYDFLLLTY